MAEKRHRIIENLEVDQYLEAQGYTECDTTTNIEIWCITSAGKLASVIWCWMHSFWESVCAGSPVATLLSRDDSTAVKYMCAAMFALPLGQWNSVQVSWSPFWHNVPWNLKASRCHRLSLPTQPLSSIYLWPVKNDISTWRASISICILLEAQRFRAEDISALSRQN